MQEQKNRISDYFAELYVAGRLADAGWNVYFPHRDHGFDFIVTKYLPNGQAVIRPVQVKGKYPQTDKTDKATYGYIGKLSQTHPQMVLAIPFFSSTEPAKPLFVAYMPFPEIKKTGAKYRCCPATFKAGGPIPRRDFKRYFNEPGIKLLEEPYP